MTNTTHCGTPNKTFGTPIRTKAGAVVATDSVYETIIQIKRFYDGGNGFAFTVDEIAHELSDYLTRKQVQSAIYHLARYANISKISTGNYQWGS